MSVLDVAATGRTRRALSTRDLADDSAWKSLYRIGGVAALAILAFIPVQIAVFLIWPPPTTVTDWFALFQSNGLVGMIDMDLLLIVDYILTGVLFLALYAVLRRGSPILMAIALSAEFVAIATYFASTVALEMFSLSGRYAAATSDPERSTLLAAGEVMIASWQGTAFIVSYLLAGAAALITSAVMLRSGPFGRVAAVSGLVFGVAGLVPPTLGMLGVTVSLLSVLPMIVWLFLVGRTLLRLPTSATSNL